jgi:hypothetical protein
MWTPPWILYFVIIHALVSSDLICSKFIGSYIKLTIK